MDSSWGFLKGLYSKGVTKASQHTSTPGAKGPRWRRALLRLVALAVVCVVLAGGGLWWFQRLLIYPGALQESSLNLPLPAGVEVWERPLPEGGVVQALWMPARGPWGLGVPGPAVVFLHGNGETARQWPQEMAWYAKRGFGVLIPEYRGFGGAAGKPSELGILDDVEHFAQRLVDLPEVDPDRLIMHGRSLGTGFAAQLAARRRPAALVLGSAFTSLPDVAHDLMGLPRWMVCDKLRVAEVLRAYGGPVLLMHGDQDQVIPVAHAHANAAAAAASGTPATLRVYAGTGHNNMPRGHGRWEDVQAFLDAAGLLPSPASAGSSADDAQAH